MILDARHTLRAATEGLHRRVDEAFAAFDLADPRAYAAALSAHARLVPGLEQALGARVWSGFTPRAAFLEADLAELGRPLPPRLDTPPLTGEANWGVQYVLEGSRLGGVMLEKQVAAGLPRRYLGAAHGAGGWRGFQAELNTAATVSEGAAWEQATDAARATFELFERAMRMELDSLGEL